MSISVKRIIPIINIIKLNIDTIAGDWSWKPHPREFPASLKRINATPIIKKDKITPLQMTMNVFLQS